MIKIDLYKYAEDAYFIAKKNGFFDVIQPDKHYICLVISELMEAVEADRRGKHCNDIEYNRNIMSESSMGSFEKSIKDTVEDELADACIRILSIAGCFGIRVGKMKCKRYQHIGGVCYDGLTHDIYDISRILTYPLPLGIKLRWALRKIFKLSDKIGMDIHTHIILKMVYNRNRPYLHGKKY